MVRRKGKVEERVKKKKALATNAGKRCKIRDMFTSMKRRNYCPPLFFKLHFKESGSGDNLSQAESV